MCCVAQPPHSAKYGQNGVSRSGEGTSTETRRARAPSRSIVTVSPGSAWDTKTGPAAPSAIPSAFAPRRAIVTCSVTACSHEEFEVAVPTCDRGGDEAQRREAQRCDERRQVLAHLAAHGHVAHDALLDAPAPGLELRLDENR